MEFPSFMEVLDFIGTFAFAISGIRLASAKQFDLFGAYVVGVVTAIGGGTLRDLMLGVTPIWMINPMYLICSGIALLWVILFEKKLVRQEVTFFIFDTIGLALFTVVGVEKALGLGFPLWVAVIMGTITGAAGGVFRDVFINEIPLIFRKEIYALACIIGGLFYGLFNWLNVDLVLTQCLSGFSVFLVRILAVKYHLGLPRLKGEDCENS
ncbi:MAG: trimeric intracellular cation channel family protein [Bacteroidaceae bacterium]|nr:trimeric intracellular cation channel family protein [Bacteroidaceae bacterium]MBR3757516.1 trimeric intracellular cation channel family protein [Bacteroidaceae bacterium]